MKKRYFLLGSLIVFGFALNASAQDIPSVAQMESQFQAQLNTRHETYGQPKATSYYDDLVDHYEKDQLMRDVIDKGIR